ncbi:MAG: hypothetical protein HFG28_12190 [Eubacterium sp.]|nr:hypothetical protein [Eubacterium sp.]
MVHGNPWTPEIWQSFPLFYYFIAQTPAAALRIKHFRKAGKKNESRKQKDQ